MKLKNYSLTIDGKPFEITGGVDVTYQPQVSEELVKELNQAKKPIQIEFTQNLTDEEFKNLQSILNRAMQKEIDFTDLQNEVIDHWENEGVEYFYHDQVSNDPVHYLSGIKPKFEDILDSPEECVFQLGYDSIADYLAENQTPTTPRKITFYMSGVLSKQWRQHVRVN